MSKSGIKILDGLHLRATLLAAQRRRRMHQVDDVAVRRRLAAHRDAAGPRQVRPDETLAAHREVDEPLDDLDHRDGTILVVAGEDREAEVGVAALSQAGRVSRRLRASPAHAGGP